MSKHLVLVGGGYAHLATLKQLTTFTGRGHQVTLVSPGPFHDYPGLAPGLLSGNTRLADLRTNIADMALAGGGRFIEAAAISIDPLNRQLHLSNGNSLGYDILSISSGSQIDLPFPKSAAGRTIFSVKPVANLFHARQKILEAARTRTERLQLLVIGGGPAACEATGSLQALCHTERVTADILQVTGRKLLGNFPEKLGNRVRSLLAEQEYRLVEGSRVTKLQSSQALLDNGQRLDFDFAFVATGLQPTLPEIIGSPAPPPMPSGLPVNSCLQTTLSPMIFAGGDCIDFVATPLRKSITVAASQAQLLCDNLLAILENVPLKTYQPGKNQLQTLNLGLHRAVALLPPILITGKPAIALKSIRDRILMKRYR